MTKSQKNTDIKKVNTRKMVEQLQEETREMLLPNLKNRMEETTGLIVNTLNTKGKDNVNNIQIMSMIAKGSLLETALGGRVTYTSQEIREAFNMYLDMINRINEIKSFPPTIESFSNFIGISRATYLNWCNDPDKKEAMEFINSYLTGILATSSLTGELKEISSIYLQKTMGKVEQVQPTVVEYKKTVDVEEIQQQIQALKNKNVIEAEWEEEQ